MYAHDGALLFALLLSKRCFHVPGCSLLQLKWIWRGSLTILKLIPFKFKLLWPFLSLSFPRRRRRYCLRREKNIRTTPRRSFKLFFYGQEIVMFSFYVWVSAEQEEWRQTHCWWKKSLKNVCKAPRICTQRFRISTPKASSTGGGRKSSLVRWLCGFGI